MKEIMAIIRMNMVNPTKVALASAGYPPSPAGNALAEGKRASTWALFETIIQAGAAPENAVGEHLTEFSRLIAKAPVYGHRGGQQVEEAVQVIIDANQTGNPGGREDLYPADHGGLHRPDRRIHNGRLLRQVRHNDRKNKDAGQIFLPRL
jgi:nitrogen regulatory protein PII 2